MAVAIHRPDPHQPVPRPVVRPRIRTRGRPRRRRPTGPAWSAATYPRRRCGPASPSISSPTCHRQRNSSPLWPHRPKPRWPAPDGTDRGHRHRRLANASRLSDRRPTNQPQVLRQGRDGGHGRAPDDCGLSSPGLVTGPRRAPTVDTSRVRRGRLRDAAGRATRRTPRRSAGWRRRWRPTPTGVCGPAAPGGHSREPGRCRRRPRSGVRVCCGARAPPTPPGPGRGRPCAGWRSSEQRPRPPIARPPGAWCARSSAASD